MLQLRRSYHVRDGSASTAETPQLRRATSANGCVEFANAQEPAQTVRQARPSPAS